MHDLRPQPSDVGQRDGKFSLGAADASGPLDDVAFQGAEAFEKPLRRAFHRCGALGGFRPDLQPTAQMVREHPAEQPDLAGGAPSTGNVADVHVLLHLREDLLLVAPSLVEGRHPTRPATLVGDLHLVLPRALHRAEEVELHRPLALPALRGPHKDEARPALPALRLPAHFEVFAVRTARHLLPAGAPLDDALEFGEALEGYAHGVFHPELLEAPHRRVAEEGRVHARLQPRLGQGLAHAPRAFGDEREGAVGVLDVAAAVQQVEGLPGLRHRAEERVVAARALPGLVEPNGGSLGVPAGAQHAAVEIQGDGDGTLRGKPVKDRAAHALAHGRDALGVEPGQQAADGRHAGDALESRDAQHHGGGAVVFDVAQPHEAQKHVDDQQAQAASVVVDAPAEMRAAGGEPPPQPQPSEEGLKDDHAAEGGHLRSAFELHACNEAPLAIIEEGWNLHFWWPSVFGVCNYVKRTLSQAEGRFQRAVPAFWPDIFETTR